MSGTNYYTKKYDNVLISLTDEFDKATFAECVGDPNVVATQSDTYVNGCIMRRTNSTGSVLYENTGNLAVPSWSQLGSGSGFTLPIITNLASGAVAEYDQNDSILGIGIKGLISAYSNDNFSTYFLGTLAGDFTSVGGEDNGMIVGYQSILGGGVANTNYSYDSISDSAEVRMEASTLAFQARIEVAANSSASEIKFDFGGSDNYIIPNIRATIPGSVLTDVNANGNLTWEVPAASNITIGSSISGGTANRILYENSTNTLQESSDLGWVDSTGQFHVSFSASNRLLINPGSNQYYIGNGGTGDTLVELLDTGGGTSMIRNWVTGRYLVQRGNAGPSLIDGDTNTFNLYLGDVGSTINKTNVEILDSIKQIAFQTDGNVYFRDTSGNKFGELRINVTNPEVYWGDLDGVGSGTKLMISDSGTSITAYSQNFGVQFSGNTSFQINNQNISMGDISGAGNDTYGLINDTLKKAYLQSTGQVYLGDEASLGNDTLITVDDNLEKFTFATGGTDRFIAYKDWTLVGNAWVTANWQSYTGAGNVAMNDNVSGLIYNPGSVNATATITLPVSSGGTGSNITIVFGGTITSGNPVVTALTIAPGAGNTIVDSAAPTTALAGDSLTYHKEGAFWYRVN